MKHWMTTALLAGTLALGAAERYESSGFSAEIGGSGVIRDLKYAGMPLATDILISGGYAIPEGVEKHDNRFFQSWDYTNNAQFERNGETLKVTVKSVMASKNPAFQVAYSTVCTLEPQKITFNCEVVQKGELLSDYYPFSSRILMVPELFGRGARVLTRNGQEEFKILPETFNPQFRLTGKEIDLSTPKGILSIRPAAEEWFNYQDSRSWGGKDFSFIVAPPAKWTPKPVPHPAGTTWKWSFTLSFSSE